MLVLWSRIRSRPGASSISAPTRCGGRVRCFRRAISGSSANRDGMADSDAQPIDQTRGGRARDRLLARAVAGASHRVLQSARG